MKYTFDSRTVCPGDVFVALKGEKADGHDFIPMAMEKGAAGVVDGLDDLQCRARAKRRGMKAKVIGITGSAGKTTTKELVKAFLAKVGRTYGTEGNFNNHIGLPLTILNAPDDAEFLVLEMGTNHPGEIAALCDIAEPDVGVLTGIGTAHLEFFLTREGILNEKGTLLARAKDFAVYPEADDFASSLAKLHPRAFAAPSAELGIGASAPPHFAENASLAFAVASRFGCTEAAAREALADFALPGSRWRKVEKGGVTFIDDTYNANPDSMKAAVDALAATPCAGRRIVVLGDMFELGDRSAAYHREVFEHAKAGKLDFVIAVGSQSSACPCDRAYRTIDALKAEFASLTRPGDVVLLKASHSMSLGSLLN